MIYITVYIDITVYYNDCYDDTIFISVKIKITLTMLSFKDNIVKDSLLLS